MLVNASYPRKIYTSCKTIKKTSYLTVKIIQLIEDFLNCVNLR